MKEVDWRKIGKVLLTWEAVLAVAASVMTGGVIGLMTNKLPPRIPLYYSLPWGEEQLAAPGEMMWALVLIWVVLIPGWLVSRRGKEPVLITFVTGAGLLSQIITALGLVRIILIIT